MQSVKAGARASTARASLVMLLCCALFAALTAPRVAAAEALATSLRAHGTLPRALHTSAREYWSTQRLRPFVGAILDVGASARGRVLLGYGRPHWTWGGVELEAGSTSDAGIAAVRARIALVVADVGLAYRQTWAYRRTFVERESGYTDRELERSPHARYRSLDLDVWGLIPAGPGFVQWEVEAVRLYGTRARTDLYEEWLRAPVRPPWATASRLAYAYTFFHGRAAVGAMAEWLWLGSRGSLYRVGPLLSYAVTPHWEATLLLTTPVHSPDDLGFFAGLYGTIRVRWRFATGEPAAIFR